MIYIVGFLAQIFFSARILVQWILSERARSVLSPSVFWVLSLAGSCLLCVYGWLRDDLAIIAGQCVSYYIYVWNLKAKGVWSVIPSPARWAIYMIPVAATAFAMCDPDEFVYHMLHNAEVPTWLMIFGVAAQLLFTLRFVYQWLYSRRSGVSTLPAPFWTISIVGATMICTYAIIRCDPVLIVGQSVGIVAYSRNLVLLRNTARAR